MPCTTPLIKISDTRQIHGIQRRVFVSFTSLPRRLTAVHVASITMLIYTATLLTQIATVVSNKPYFYLFICAKFVYIYNSKNNKYCII